MWVCVCNMHVGICVQVEAKDRCCHLPLELHCLTSKVPGSAYPLPVMLGIQGHSAMAGFLQGCWGLELGSSCLHNKHCYSRSPVPGSTFYTLTWNFICRCPILRFCQGVSMSGVWRLIFVLILFWDGISYIGQASLVFAVHLFHLPELCTMMSDSEG